LASTADYVGEPLQLGCGRRWASRRGAIIIRKRRQRLESHGEGRILVHGRISTADSQRVRDASLTCPLTLRLLRPWPGCYLAWLVRRDGKPWRIGIQYFPNERIQ
jgi:hypothetical protein